MDAIQQRPTHPCSRSRGACCNGKRCSVCIPCWDRCSEAAPAPESALLPTGGAAPIPPAPGEAHVPVTRDNVVIIRWQAGCSLHWPESQYYLDRALCPLVMFEPCGYFPVYFGDTSISRSAISEMLCYTVGSGVLVASHCQEQLLDRFLLVNCLLVCKGRLTAIRFCCKLTDSIFKQCRIQWHEARAHTPGLGDKKSVV